MAKKKQPSPAKAKEILHDGTIRGKKITEKQRKFFGAMSNMHLGGKMENENNNSTLLPQGFVGQGYYSPQWKSPAWGGQFQMGGNLPGTVGFDYARTGSTPSNGKGAKKTLPSAQLGKRIYPIETWKSQGLVSADTVSRGTMYRIPYRDQHKLYNTPISNYTNPDELGYMTVLPGGIDPDELAKKKLDALRSVKTYDISGKETGIDHPQGSHVNFQNGGNIYYQNGLDFKTKGMQDGGELFDTKALKKRNQKRDSVREALYEKYPKPIDYQKVNKGMLDYFQQEKVIKDDTGYWNPKNKGKAVQIDSNKITMNGVDQPLLGVSDTNHVQMMQPGGEYSFHGSNVTEYPLNGGNQNKGQLKKLKQLTDFTNNNNMEQGKSGIHIKPSHKGLLHKHLGISEGKKIPASKLSIKPGDSAKVRKQKTFAKNAKSWHHGQDGLNLSQYNTTAPNFGPPQGMSYQPLNLGQQQQVSQYGNYQSPSPNLTGQGESTMGGSTGGGNMLGNIGQGMNVVGGVIKGIKMLKQEKIQKQQAEQSARLSDVVAQASETRPERVKRKYVRPEDMVVQPNQMFPSQGTGTNYLAKNGTSIIGEIQNTYAPNTLYTDLGYEPLNESGKVKQFQIGGLIQGQTDQWGQSIGGSLGSGNLQGSGNGGSQVGSSIGGAIGNAIVPGLGGIVGGFAGGVIGGALDRNARKITQFQNETNKNTNRIGIQQGAKNLQTQNSSFMKEGGWLSHNWNPQVITKFGDYTAKEVYDIAHEGMHSLRTGGNIRQNNMAMGGELTVHGGGHAESLSANPYLPDGGETVMFRGKSHANGGMPISFGKQPVEVEGGEPAVKLQDGGTGEDNLVVFGNMTIPSYGVNEIGDKDAKGMKFKNYIAKLSEKEAKQNKVVSKGLKLINDTDDSNSFDQLKIASGKALLQGGNMKLKLLAEKKQAAANVQNAILETAEEHGLESDALAKGKIKKAKNGGKMSYAQQGMTFPKKDYSDMFKAVQPTITQDNLLNSYEYSPKEKSPKGKGLNTALTAVGSLWPYFRPTNQIGLDPSQLAGEYYSLASNQLDPVNAQRYTPLLDQPYDISFQDQLNANQADFNALQRQTGNNPAAQSILAGQKYAANSRVLGEQFRANQANKAGVYSKNRDILNDAQLKNLALLDQQYVRQSQAKSNTKSIAQSALSSIASKIAQNKLENRTLGVYENLYGYRYDNQGRAYNLNSPAQFNIPQNSSDLSIDQLQSLIDKKKKDKGKNGYLVKALK